MKTKIDETIESLAAGKIGVNEAISNLLSDQGVKVGSKVAVYQDPTFPFDGQAGKVVKMEGGFADVEFPNGTTVPLQVSLLAVI